MLDAFIRWLKGDKIPEDDVSVSYAYVFGGPHGEKVLFHLLDGIYCQVYGGNEQMQLAYHNGRRSVVHEILQNIDLGLKKHKPEIKTDDTFDPRKVAA